MEFNSFFYIILHNVKDKVVTNNFFYERIKGFHVGQSNTSMVCLAHMRIHIPSLYFRLCILVPLVNTGSKKDLSVSIDNMINIRNKMAYETFNRYPFTNF